MTCSSVTEESFRTHRAPSLPSTASPSGLVHGCVYVEFRNSSSASNPYLDLNCIDVSFFIENGPNLMKIPQNVQPFAEIHFLVLQLVSVTRYVQRQTTAPARPVAPAGEGGGTRIPARRGANPPRGGEFSSAVHSAVERFGRRSINCGRII